jgi:hypothetical protein
VVHIQPWSFLCHWRKPESWCYFLIFTFQFSLLPETLSLPTAWIDALLMGHNDKAKFVCRWTQS